MLFSDLTKEPFYIILGYLFEEIAPNRWLERNQDCINKLLVLQYARGGNQEVLSGYSDYGRWALLSLRVLPNLVSDISLLSDVLWLVYLGTNAQLLDACIDIVGDTFGPIELLDPGGLKHTFLSL